MLKTVHLFHMPPELALYVALYRDVKNAAFLREQLLAGNTEFEYAFVDASMILTTSHILAAAFRAMNDYLHERLKSRNVHSEIVFALSPSNNIGEAFRKFGVADTTSDLLVMKVSTSPSITFESVSEHLTASIQGTPVDFSDETLASMSDLSKITKAYKISGSGPAGGKSAKKSKDQIGSVSADDMTAGRESKELEVAILGAMALRGAT